MNYSSVSQDLVVVFNAEQLHAIAEKVTRLSCSRFDVIALCDEQEYQSIKSAISAFPQSFDESVTSYHFNSEPRVVSFIKDAVIYRADTRVFLPRSWPMTSDETDLIKALFSDTHCHSIYLMGHAKWSSKPCVMAAIDVLDESKEQQQLDSVVVARAAEQVEKLDGSLHLLSVVPMSFFTLELEILSQEEVRNKKLADVMDKQQRVYSQLALTQPYTQYVEAGAPYEEIQSTAKRINANLAVIGNVGRTGLSGLIIGNTAEKILNHLRMDALITR